MKKLFIIAISIFALVAFTTPAMAGVYAWGGHTQTESQDDVAFFGYGPSLYAFSVGTQKETSTGGVHSYPYGGANVLTKFGQNQGLYSTIDLGYGGNQTNFITFNGMAQKTKGKAENYGEFGSINWQFGIQTAHATRDWNARSMTTGTGQLGLQCMQGWTKGNAMVKTKENLYLFGEYDRTAQYGNTTIHQAGFGYINMGLKGKAHSCYCGHDSYHKGAFAAQNNVTRNTNDGIGRNMSSSQETSAMYRGNGSADMFQSHGYEQSYNGSNAYQYQWGGTTTSIHVGNGPS